MNFGWLLHPFRLALLLAGFVLMALAASAAPARADLRVCNQSTNQVSIALGYRAEKGWQSEGWWVAPSGKCAVVYQGDLHSRFFYLYVADDIGGGAWDGTNFMCTRDESFTIFGVEDCLARGYERTGFFEVDTQNRTDWTLQLTDPTNNDNTVTDNGDAAPLEGDDNASTQPDQPDQGQDEGTDGGDGGDDSGTD
ncbi:MAG: hypothetical protein BGO82_00545 [Devosia sp. 67-54]|uniref:DUF1036 domain-containing protein n=1 Tax=unclassified Devosia TaxID=196773 RepID=UPI00095D09E2|nr:MULTISPECIES: DUF1036 domain-containing protein [unclassified Devosia]MBN9306048.1 DUF1036 domain-containing protein [Devosia sp.]OJX16279.1 MAG: hypothetical protein BGO82_00545 [Devosia sp. 67-54]